MPKGQDGCFLFFFSASAGEQERVERTGSEEKTDSRRQTLQCLTTGWLIGDGDTQQRLFLMRSTHVPNVRTHTHTNHTHTFPQLAVWSSKTLSYLHFARLQTLAHPHSHGLASDFHLAPHAQLCTNNAHENYPHRETGIPFTFISAAATVSLFPWLLPASLFVFAF